VHSCGFDSVPSDLGVWLTADQARRDGAGGLAETVLTVRRLRGGLSGGTIDSMRQQVIAARKDSAARRVLRDPASLEGSSTGEETSRRGPAEVPDRHTHRGVRSPVRREPTSGRWRIPFVMGGFNGPLVRRSHALTEGGYGPGFRYRELQ